MYCLLCLCLCTLPSQDPERPSQEEVALAKACGDTIANDFTVESFEKLLAPKARKLKGDELAIDFITDNLPLLGKDSQLRNSLKLEPGEPIAITSANTQEAFMKVNDLLAADPQNKKTIPMKNGKVDLDLLKKKWPNLFDEISQGRTAFFLPCTAEFNENERQVLTTFIVVGKIDNSLRITLLDDK